MNKVKKKLELLYWPIVVTVFLILGYVQYYALVHYHYAVPPGDDPFSHYRMAEGFYSKSSSFLEIWRNGGYPPLFHLFLANTARLFHTDVLKVMLAIYPSILIFTSLSVYFLAYTIFGKYAALISLILYAFGAGTPLWLLNDGGYPNLLAASLFLPSSIAFFILFCRSKKALYLAGSILFALLVVLTHHISTYYLLALVVTSSPPIILSSWILYRWPVKKGVLLVIIYLIFLSFIFILYDHSSVLAPAKGLSSSMISVVGHYPFVEIMNKNFGTGAIWPKRDYAKNIGGIVFFSGIAGICYAVFSKRKQLKEFYIPVIILIVWTGLLYAGSRLPFLSNPERMARDLAVPLSIFAGYFLSDIFAAKFIRSKIFSISFAACFLILFLRLSAISRINNARKIDPMVRITKADEQAIKEINSSAGDNDLIYTNATHTWLNYFLPKQRVVNVETDTELKKVSYFYVIKGQKGWSPGPINFGIDQNLTQKGFVLLSKHSSETNEVWLYKKIN